MARVVLFGGGDAGGLVFTANGVRRIPPFDPGLIDQLQGVSRLVTSLVAQPVAEDARELSSLVHKTANLTVARVEAAIGALDEQHGLTFLDEDGGGFVCGSTGQPPIPIPKPGSPVPSLREMIARGAIDPQLMTYVEAATAKGISAAALLEEPTRVAAELKVPLSAQAAEDLARLSPSRLAEFSDPVDAELVRYFHRVVDKPELLAAWATRPHDVATSVGVELSDAALDRLLAVGDSARLGPGAADNPVAIAVAVGIVIMLVDRPAEIEQLAVSDLSGLAKF